MENERAQIYHNRDFGRVANAWRRLPDFPEWHVSVHFGDDGYGCDPGVYSEPINTAIAEVEKAIEDLTQMLVSLREFRRTRCADEEG